MNHAMVVSGDDLDFEGRKHGPVADGNRFRRSGRLGIGNDPGNGIFAMRQSRVSFARRRQLLLRGVRS